MAPFRSSVLCDLLWRSFFWLEWLSNPLWYYKRWMLSIELEPHGSPSSLIKIQSRALQYNSWRFETFHNLKISKRHDCFGMDVCRRAELENLQITLQQVSFRYSDLSDPKAISLKGVGSTQRPSI